MSVDKAWIKSSAGGMQVKKSLYTSLVLGLGQDLDLSAPPPKDDEDDGGNGEASGPAGGRAATAGTSAGSGRKAGGGGAAASVGKASTADPKSAPKGAAGGAGGSGDNGDGTAAARSKSLFEELDEEGVQEDPEKEVLAFEVKADQVREGWGGSGERDGRVPGGAWKG